VICHAHALEGVAFAFYVAITNKAARSLACVHNVAPTRGVCAVFHGFCVAVNGAAVPQHQRPSAGGNADFRNPRLRLHPLYVLRLQLVPVAGGSDAKVGEKGRVVGVAARKYAQRVIFLVNVFQRDKALDAVPSLARTALVGVQPRATGVDGLFGASYLWRRINAHGVKRGYQLRRAPDVRKHVVNSGVGTHRPHAFAVTSARVLDDAMDVVGESRGFPGG